MGLNPEPRSYLFPHRTGGGGADDFDLVIAVVEERNLFLTVLLESRFLIEVRLFQIGLHL